MKPVRPRALKHRGVIEATGFVFDLRLLSLTEAQRRALSVWTPGAQVFHLDEALMIRLSAPQLVVSDQAIGAPLIAMGEALLATPLVEDEKQALAVSRNSMVLAQGGLAIVVQLDNALKESPANWLDVELFTFVETASLGLRPAGPRMVAQKQNFDARQQLEGVPAEAPELAGVLSALRAAAKPSAPSSSAKGPMTNWRDTAAKLLERVISFLNHLPATMAKASATVRRLLGKLLGSLASAQPARASRQSASALSKSSPSVFERLADRLQQFALKMLIATRLSRVIGKRQAAYINRLMEMFERGDMQEALRHAIPIDGMASALNSPALRVPLARTSLTISPHQTTARSSIFMGDELLGELRRLYRASFTQLEAQGRIEEAAFVLAELLQANEEAVAFLERHGRLQLAAEMAEARELAPGLVVRQWFIAGNVARALRIARREQAFAHAVLRLEHSQRKADAEKLRLLWAAALAEAGDYAAAVEVIWPVQSARMLARDWLEKAIATGGVSGARMLARKLSLLPEAFREVKEPTLALMDDESPEQASARASFAKALRGGASTPQAKTLARAAIRAFLRDAAQGYETVSLQEFRQLIAFADDAALRADAPPLPTGNAQLLGLRCTPLRLHFAAADVGTLEIWDAALLPDGRMVAALGEAGTRLLTRDGRTLVHFDQPAHRLVISDNGDRAIALAQRGEVWKLARLDFLARRAVDWCEARIGAFACDYDGAMWFIGNDNDFYAIDATAKGFDALWRVPDVEGQAIQITRSPSQCIFVVSDWGFGQWQYELPSLRLRHRSPIRCGKGDCIYLSSHFAVSLRGIVADQSLTMEIIRRKGDSPPEQIEQSFGGKPLPCHLRLHANDELWKEIELGDETCQSAQPAISDDWVAAPVIDRTEARVSLVDLQQGEVRAEFTLERATEVRVRLQSQALTIADSRGRLLALDLRSGQLIRDLRL